MMQFLALVAFSDASPCRLCTVHAYASFNGRRVQLQQESSHFLVMQGIGTHLANRKSNSLEWVFFTTFTPLNFALGTYIWIINIPHWTTVVVEFNHYIDWETSIIWIPSSSENNFPYNAHCIVEEPPFWGKICIS